MDRGLASSGLLVVAVDMTVAPEAPYPACVQDAMDGVDAVGACRRAFEIRSAGDGRTAQDQSASRADVDSDHGLTGPR